MNIDVLLISGMFIACALSLAAFVISRRRYKNLKLSREIAAMQFELADVTEKIVHQSKLFKKMSARLGQRERREKESERQDDNGTGSLTGEQFKQAWRRSNLDKLALNKGR